MSSTPPPRRLQRRMVIVDQDTTGPGTTNTNSIALLLQTPDVDVLGITVASGDGWVSEEVLHVLRLLEILNRTDVPVYSGSLGPLMPLSQREVMLRNSLLGNLHTWHGGWSHSTANPHYVNKSNFNRTGLPDIKPAALSASEFLAVAVREHPHQISILSLAPMTNIAGAMVIEPRLPELAKELVFMGGSISCGSNPPLSAHCDPGQSWHEMNLWFDPHAAKKVLRTVPFVTGNWSRIVGLPSDVASQPTWDSRLQDGIRALEHKHVLADYIVKYTLESQDNSKFPLFDELSVVLWAAGMPAGMTSHAVQLDIDCSIGEVSSGALLTWPPGKGPGLGEQQATILLGDVNLEAFEAKVLELIKESPPPPSLP